MSKKIFKEADFSYEIIDTNGKTVEIIRTKGNHLLIDAEYQGAYGMGEKFDQINQIGKRVTNQVVEKFCNQGNISYCVTPFFVTDTGIGIYINTKEKTEFSFQKEIECEIPESAAVYIFNGDISDVVAEYMKIFGKAKLPPEYAFGIWISANHWNRQTDVEYQLNELKKYDFPASVIVLEAWSDEATFYIWNGAKYIPKKESKGFKLDEFDFSESEYWKDPMYMIEEIHGQGLKLVLWQIPVFKGQGKDEQINDQLVNDTEYALEKNLCIRNADGTPYKIPKGNWFETSYIPDFTNKETKDFWFNNRKYLLEMGVDGFKTDGGEFIYDQTVTFSDGTTGAEGKNQYSQDYVNAYTDFIADDNVLFSRAGYAGNHTTPILWAGDHQSTNEELKNVLVAGLSAAMSGITYWGFDIGGFAGPMPSLDLYRRSTQFACFCPVMQWHSEPDGGQFKELMPGGKGNNERSPWNVAAYHNSPEFMDEMRYWHNLRMQLLPYILSEAKKSSEEYKPMMRPLIYVYPEDKKVIGVEDEYLFGESILVAPLLNENQTIREVYLPEGVWYGFFSDKRHTGNDICTSEEEKMPVYVKEGEAIPFKQDEELIIKLYGKTGNKDLILNDKQVSICWSDNVATLKGVIEEKYEFIFVV